MNESVRFFGEVLKVVKEKVVTPLGEGEKLGGGSGRPGRSRRDTLTEPDIIVREYFISTFDFNVRHFLFSPKILTRYLSILQPVIFLIVMFFIVFKKANISHRL